MNDHFLKLNGMPVNLDEVTGFVDIVDLSHIEIKLQSAPVSEVGVNGLQIDDVIVIIKDILASFQKAYPCRETALAITKLEEAKAWCDIRTAHRIKRGVEGKSEI